MNNEDMNMKKIVDEYLSDREVRKSIDAQKLVNVDGLVVLNDSQYVSLDQKDNPVLLSNGKEILVEITYGDLAQKKDKQISRLQAYYHSLFSSYYTTHNDLDESQVSIVKEPSAPYGTNVKTVKNGNADSKKTTKQKIWKDDLVNSNPNPVIPRIGDDWFEEDGYTFSQSVCELLERKNISAPECYGRAGINRGIFSRLRNEKDFIPKKNICVSICFGLQLGIDATDRLLKIGGYALGNIMFDRVCRCYLTIRNYDLININEELNNKQCKDRIGSKIRD